MVVPYYVILTFAFNATWHSSPLSFSFRHLYQRGDWNNGLLCIDKWEGIRDLDNGCT
jgi:hypothetical protein